MTTENTTEELPPLVAADDDGIRPAGPPDACLYCRQKVGQRHQLTCVIWTRPVELLLTIGLIQQVPHHWTELGYGGRRTRPATTRAAGSP